jgi:transglutaminase-like putative cysteine protease
MSGNRTLAPGPARLRPTEATRRVRAWLQPQISSGAREQRDQAVLLIAVAMVVAPHFEHLPLWSTVVIGVIWIWRAWLAQTLKPAPGKTTMALLLAAGTLAVWLEHGTLFGRDASVNFLLVLISLKVLEMRAHRDVLVIVFLSLFVLQTQFLFDQSLLSAVSMVISVGMLFFVLLSVNLPEGDIAFGGKLRYLARVFLMALPLTLTLFFLFPRLSSPLWGSGGDDLQSGTGLSGSMSPGSIKNLLRDDSVALRAKFERRIPDQRKLYWRGPVFGYFDGRTWSSLDDALGPAGGRIDVRVDAASATDYTVTLEPTQRRELIALEYADRIDGVPTIEARLTPTLELQTGAPIVSRLRYTVHSYTTYSAGPRTTDATLGSWLQLPDQFNPRTLAWAAQLKSEALAEAARDRVAAAPPLDRRLVEAVLLQFRRLPFRYSINVGLLGRNSVDEFLFDQRVGFCEHYASSFVVLMRAMGVPARVVTGYQGGEINPVDGFFTVRQSDAHAWAEVWLQGYGWQRIDPTAAVAPERIEHTLRERRAEGLAGLQDRWSWLGQLRLNREALENAWNQWFLSYSADRQRALMSWIGLRPNLENVTVVAIAAFSALLVVLAIVSLRRRAVRDPLAELTYALRAKLAGAGVPVPASMGLQDMQEHLATQLDPQCMAETRRLLADLATARYARPVPGQPFPRLRELRAAVRRWRPLRAPAAWEAESLTPAP